MKRLILGLWLITSSVLASDPLQKEIDALLKTVPVVKKAPAPPNAKRVAYLKMKEDKKIAFENRNKPYVPPSKRV